MLTYVILSLSNLKPSSTSTDYWLIVLWDTEGEATRAWLSSRFSHSDVLRRQREPTVNFDELWYTRVKPQTDERVNFFMVIADV